MAKNMLKVAMDYKKMPKIDKGTQKILNVARIGQNMKKVAKRS